MKRGKLANLGDASVRRHPQMGAETKTAPDDGELGDALILSWLQFSRRIWRRWGKRGWVEGLEWLASGLESGCEMGLKVYFPNL